MSPLLFTLLTISSGYNLLFLSIERFQAITKPLSYDEQRIKSKLFIVIPVIWLTGVILLFPDPFFFKVKGGGCRYTAGLWNKRDSLLLFAYYSCSSFLIPGFTMLYLYAKMGLVIWGSRKMQQTMVSKTSTKKDTLSKAQTNIFFTCVLLLVFYFMCWLSNVTTIMLYLAEFIEFSSTVINISAILLLVNSVINPFIYTIRYDDFKVHLYMLICGKTNSYGAETSSRSVRTVSENI